VGLSFVFFAFTFGKKLTPLLFLRISLMVSCGILVTHLFRWVIRQLNWLLQPIEKVLPKLLLAIVVASLTCSLLVLGITEYFNM